MTVEELWDELKKLSPGMGVFVSKDEEGNDIKPLYAVEEMFLDGDNELVESDDPSGRKVVVLWP